jgi:hypothetical protein
MRYLLVSYSQTQQNGRCANFLRPSETSTTYFSVLKLCMIMGRAIAQAVSRRLPTAAARVQTRVWSCEILGWTKVALGQVFSENFGFPCQSTFNLLLHNHLHSHPRLAQKARSGRSANSLTNQTKKKKIYNMKRIFSIFCLQIFLVCSHSNIW